MESPYKNLPKEKWMEKTRELVDNHPLKDKIKDVVLKSWNDIFNSKIGSFSIGKKYSLLLKFLVSFCTSWLLITFH